MKYAEGLLNYSTAIFGGVTIGVESNFRNSSTGRCQKLSNNQNNTILILNQWTFIKRLTMQYITYHNVAVTWFNSVTSGCIECYISNTEHRCAAFQFEVTPTQFRIDTSWSWYEPIQNGLRSWWQGLHIVGRHFTECLLNCPYWFLAINARVSVCIDSQADIRMTESRSGKYPFLIRLNFIIVIRGNRL